MFLQCSSNPPFLPTDLARYFSNPRPARKLGFCVVKKSFAVGLLPFSLVLIHWRLKMSSKPAANSYKEALLLFYNDSNLPVKIIWVNGEAECHYYTLQPNAKYCQGRGTIVMLFKNNCKAKRCMPLIFTSTLHCSVFGYFISAVPVIITCPDGLP